MVLKYGGVLTHAGRKQVMIIYASCTCFCILISLSIYKEYSNKIVAENYTCAKLLSVTYCLSLLFSLSVLILLLSFLCRLKIWVDISGITCIQVIAMDLSHFNL